MKHFSTKFVSKLDNLDIDETISKLLAPYDTSLLEEIKFLELRSATDFYGACDLPVNNLEVPGNYLSGYRIRCAINTNTEFPLTYNTEIARHRSDETGQAASVEYEHKIIFDDLDALALWLAGRTLYKFILHSRNIHVEPVDCHANSFGLDWLVYWRNFQRVSAH